MPLRSQIRNGIHHIGRVPSHYRIGHKVETAGLIGLIFGLMPPNVSLIGEKEKLPKGMECLPLVELGVNAPSIVWGFRQPGAERPRGWDAGAKVQFSATPDWLIFCPPGPGTCVDWA